MILQKPEGSGSEQRGRMTGGGVFQDTESGNAKATAGLACSWAKRPLKLQQGV